MKRLLFIMMIACVAGAVSAQPRQRRTQQQTTQQRQQASQQMTPRMRIQYPTALDMPEDVVWRRDIYRELDLNDNANAGLYYPVQPQGRQMNLFTYIFKLAQNGYIPVYEYSVANDGNDVFTDSTKVDLKSVLDDYHIYYEEQDGKLRVDNSDIPSQEVRKYYLKESAYYDQANSSFHIKVLALCPIMLRDDDFGGEATQYPLFWVRYSDLEPFLSRQSVMTSNLNNAATMSMDDYFTLNKYGGKIYKTTNMLGKTLAQVVGNDSTRLTAEQQRIEAELVAFRNNIFGDRQKRDSIDSIATADPKAAKTAKARTRRQASGETRQRATRTRRSSSPSSSGNSAARVTVRRERH